MHLIGVIDHIHLIGVIGRMHLIGVIDRMHLIGASVLFAEVACWCCYRPYVIAMRFLCDCYVVVM